MVARTSTEIKTYTKRGEEADLSNPRFIDGVCFDYEAMTRWQGGNSARFEGARMLFNWDGVKVMRRVISQQTPRNLFLAKTEDIREDLYALGCEYDEDRYYFGVVVTPDNALQVIQFLTKWGFYLKGCHARQLLEMLPAVEPWNEDPFASDYDDELLFDSDNEFRSGRGSDMSGMDADMREAMYGNSAAYGEVAA